jgi:hypothetical protein
VIQWDSHLEHIGRTVHINVNEFQLTTIRRDTTRRAREASLGQQTETNKQCGRPGSGEMARAWERPERRIGPWPSLSTSHHSRRRRQLWLRRRRLYLPYPPLPPRFTVQTLWVATSVLPVLLPYRVDRAPRVAHAPSQCPLVEKGALRVPRTLTRQWQQRTIFLSIPHFPPLLQSPLTPPLRHFLHVPRVHPYVPRHCRKTTSHTQISCQAWAGKLWMIWKARGGPEE